jgi:ankyrin repeat protein
VSSSEQQSPLVLAILDGDIERVRALVSLGSNVNEPDRYGWLPIHRAAANDRDVIIAYLITQGSLLEATGTDQWTPLHLACVSGSFDAVVTLVKLGANVNAVARNGDTPLHLALTCVIPPQYDELHRDSVQRTTRAIKTLLSAGADPRACDVRGRIPADVARARGALTLAKVLDIGSPT